MPLVESCWENLIPSRELNQFALVQPGCIFLHKMRRTERARGERESKEERENGFKIKAKLVINFYILS